MIYYYNTSSKFDGQLYDSWWSSAQLRELIAQHKIIGFVGRTSYLDASRINNQSLKDVNSFAFSPFAVSFAVIDQRIVNFVNDDGRHIFSVIGGFFVQVV